MNRNALIPTLAACLVCPLAAGCGSHLPTYAERDAPASLATIAQRLASVETIQSEATVDFLESDGATVRLDAALAARLPDMLRLRAWKLDRAVFDATLRDGELWMLPEGDDRPGGGGDSGLAAQGVFRAFTLLAPAFYETATVDAARTTARELVVNGTAEGDTITCVIDRATLTPRHFERAADRPGSELSVDLADYLVVDGVPWPGTWTITHPRGRVVIRMADVSLNSELPPEALVPPRRAVRKP